jgi:hypothetical protein
MNGRTKKHNRVLYKKSMPVDRPTLAYGSTQQEHRILETVKIETRLLENGGNL